LEVGRCGDGGDGRETREIDDVLRAVHGQFTGLLAGYSTSRGRQSHLTSCDEFVQTSGKNLPKPDERVIFRVNAGLGVNCAKFQDMFMLANTKENGRRMRSGQGSQMKII
jgi:hypothetical protein